MSCLTPNLLASLEAGTMGDAAAREAREHLNACFSCKERHDELLATARLLAKPDFAEASPAPETWRAIEETIRAESAPSGAVSVACTFCKGGLKRPEAVYCAQCLAPHHGDCWEEHGRCAACGAKFHVRASPRRSSRNVARILFAGAVATVLAGAAVATLVMEVGAQRDRARTLAEEKLQAEIDAQRAINAQLAIQNEKERELERLRKELAAQASPARTLSAFQEAERKIAELQAKLRAFEQQSDRANTTAEMLREKDTLIALLQTTLKEQEDMIFRSRPLPEKPASRPVREPEESPRAPSVAEKPSETSQPLGNWPPVWGETPPSRVEAFDKCRIVVRGTKNHKGQLTLDVKGAAYYPDGTKYYLTARHAKSDQVFARVQTTVEKHAFTAAIGPLHGTVPGGEIVVDAWFDFIAQPGPIKAKILKGDESSHGSYFHCPDGCKYDKKNLAIARYAYGGPKAQANDEQLEKDQLAKARTALLDARRACRRDSARALGVLEEDTGAALEAFGQWKKSRVFLFFAKAEENLSQLGEAIAREAKLATTANGIAISGFSPTNPKEELASATGEVERLSDALKGFLDEKDSLDKQWDAYEKAHRGQAVSDARGYSAEDEKAEHAKRGFRLLDALAGAAEIAGRGAPKDFEQARENHAQACELLDANKSKREDLQPALERLVSETKESMERFAPALAEKTLADAVALTREKRYQEALDVLDAFPTELAETPAGKSVANKRRQLEFIVPKK